MVSQSVEKIIETLAEYGVPLIKLYAIISVVGAVVFIIFFFAVFIMTNIPAADVAPVIHSEWERHMSFGICRNCKYEYNWTGTDAKNYCPNCGAKMNEGD